MSATVSKLDAGLRSELQAKRLLKEREETAALDLPHVAMTETVLGTMTPDEQLLFIEYAERRLQFEEAHKMLVADHLTRAGNQLRQLGKLSDFDLSKAQVFETEEAAQDFFELMTSYEYLHAMLVYELGKRFGFGQKFGYRKGFVVVRTSYRYDNNFK